jgi:hypothetical protein
VDNTQSCQPPNLKSNSKRVVLSSALVVPFVILELVNRRNYHEGFPVLVFLSLWLLPTAFTLILRPTATMLRNPDRRLPEQLGVFLGIGLMILITLLWVGVVADQMPCFMGVPNCD